MSEVMLTFGTVAFSVDEAAYQALRRTARFRVAAQENVGERPGYHFTGPGEEAIVLSGVIMPTYRGRPAVLNDLRALAAEGRSRTLTSGLGEGLGRWILQEVTEEQSALFVDGQARKVGFSIRLLRDEDEPSGRTDRLERDAAARGDAAGVVEATRAAVARGDASPDVIAAARGAL